ncbi:hypothetical protein BpHYR1_003261 [Brachionus plicatilis]|uniref:Uncharacterized protein n=1 Tax=Brachionus plicatilis TaxID=10195 RepID=A0A3M7QRX5_BRAPC|nr:hypothetical protein BpHYR1_003261 [Brachionus plicatilis]
MNKIHSITILYLKVSVFTNNNPVSKILGAKKLIICEERALTSRRCSANDNTLTCFLDSHTCAKVNSLVSRFESSLRKKSNLISFILCSVGSMFIA